MSWMSRQQPSWGQSSRRAKLLCWLESILQDARFGLRMLRKDRAATAAALLSLSLVIGACTAAFSLIDALILRSLPVPEPDKLVRLTYQNEGTEVSAVLFDRLLEASHSQVDLFGNLWGTNQPVIFDDSRGEEESVQVEAMSGDGFRILGIRPKIGRVLAASDDGRAVAVLSHRFWTRRFGADPTVIGRWFYFRGSGNIFQRVAADKTTGRPFQIVGIAKQGFSGMLPGSATDLWFPRMTEYAGWEQVWGRLKAGIGPEQARQVLQAAFTNFRREHLGDVPGAPADQVAEFINARVDLRSASRGRAAFARMEFERPLWILAVVAGLVMLIACSNVASLQVARAAGREREMAMRISIGAGRMRLMQQLLIENSLLAGAACILGLAFASATAPSIVNLLSPSGYPAVYLDLHLDLRILAFLAVIAVSTTVLFGLAPALRASSVSPQKALKAVGARLPGKIGILRPLVAAQVGFSFMVLFAGGLLMRSFHQLTHVNLGFSKEGIVLIDIQGKALKGGDARMVVWKLLNDIRRLPAVQAASLSGQGLVGGFFGSLITPRIRFTGHEPEQLRPSYLAVSPGFFETMRIPLLEGRDFTASDPAPGSTAVVVNQAFIRHYFSGENPLGKSFEVVGYPAKQEIVGVVSDAKYNNVREENSPIIYGPLRELNATLEVRAVGDPLTMAPTLRQAIRGVNPALRVARVMLQSTRIENSLLRERLLALLATFFSVVAMVLAAVGLYGVLSYSVVRRTKEIGIRVALGARQLGIVRLVTSDIMWMVAFGLAAGVAGGLVLARFSATLLFNVKPSGFWSLAIPLACLLTVAAWAVVPAAFRSARVDPMVALRQD